MTIKAEKHLREKYGIVHFFTPLYTFRLVVNEHETRLEVYHGPCTDKMILIQTIDNDLPKIIEHLTKHLNEKQSRELEKFFFERI